MKKVALSLVILGGLLNGFADAQLPTDKFFGIKVTGDIIIPIDGRKARVDIDTLNIKVNDDCQISLPILAEYLNLRTLRYEPQDIKVNCGNDVYESKIYDADAATGIKLRFEKKNNQFERKLTNDKLDILIVKKIKR